MVYDSIVLVHLVLKKLLLGAESRAREFGHERARLAQRGSAAGSKDVEA